MKIVKLSVLVVLFFIFFVQTSQVLAKHSDNGPISGPVTNPITSPITSPLCKPGWGFGDKNHCHFGPPGLFGKNFEKFLTNDFSNIFNSFNSIFHIKKQV